MSGSGRRSGELDRPIPDSVCPHPDNSRNLEILAMRIIAIGLAALSFATCAPAAAPSSAPGEIDWKIQRHGTKNDGSVIQFNVESHWGRGQTSTWGNDRPIGEFQGLSAGQVTGPTGPVRFAIVREAGRLDCDGVAGRLVGSGTCSFTADPGFADFLATHGIGRPTERQAFTLAMSEVGRELVASLEGFSYPRPTIDQLSAMGIHGVSPAFVSELAQQGYKLKSGDELVNFKIHGVDIEYIRDLAAIGPQFDRFAADDLVSMKIHGVKPDYVRAMAAIGPAFATLTADDLVSFAIHGAKPEMVQAFARHGRSPLRAEGVTAMAVHGVSASFIDEMAALGYKGFTADELVKLKIHGVTSGYARSLQVHGMKNLDADQLVRLKISGFEPNFR